MIVLSVECESDFLSKLTESPNHCLVRLHLQNHVVAIAVGKPEHASFAAICCDKKWEKQPQHTRNPVHLPHKQSAAIIYLTVLSTVVRYYPQRHANMYFRTCDLHGDCCSHVRTRTKTRMQRFHYALGRSAVSLFKNIRKC